MRILLVEDEDRIASFLVRALEAEGNHCVHCENGCDALDLALNGDFDLILLDIMLPEMSGIEVCQQLRSRCKQTPIIMLSAMDTNDDIIHGLKMGADDYITKPFLIDVLLARISAVIRRGKNTLEPEPALQYGSITFDRNSMRVTAEGNDIDLSAKEISILELLMSNPSRMFSRERILSNIWGINYDPLTNIVDVYIGRLRKKLDTQSAGESVIETVRGMGYRLRKIDGA